MNGGIWDFQFENILHIYAIEKRKCGRSMKINLYFLCCLSKMNGADESESFLKHITYYFRYAVFYFFVFSFLSDSERKICLTAFEITNDGEESMKTTNAFHSNDCYENPLIYFPDFPLLTNEKKIKTRFCTNI